jgi:hypothetical protein
MRKPAKPIHQSNYMRSKDRKYWRDVVVPEWSKYMEELQQWKKEHPRKKEVSEWGEHSYEWFAARKQWARKLVEGSPSGTIMSGEFDGKRWIITVGPRGGVSISPQ